ncbi:hypothetical protein ACLB2K_072241 [Fragaria x ananassa]
MIECSKRRRLAPPRRRLAPPRRSQATSILGKSFHPGDSSPSNRPGDYQASEVRVRQVLCLCGSASVPPPSRSPPASPPPTPLVFDINYFPRDQRRNRLRLFDISQTEGSRKRKRVDETDKIVVALEKVFEESGKKMQMVIEVILKGNEDRSDIAKELNNMGLSVDDQIAALGIILERPQNISIFKSLDNDVKAVYVQNLLMGNR